MGVSEHPASLVTVIFSKDRAMQLDACLRSFTLQCSEHFNCRKHVIYQCSDSDHSSQYATLRDEHPDVLFIREGDFFQDLQRAIAGFDFVLFVVDDNIFVRPFSLASVVAALTTQKEALGFSLRLGRNITRCYSYNDALQKIPDATKLDDGILLFRWTEALLDFAYPLEVSSSVFRISQLQTLLHPDALIKHPNSLEECLDRGKHVFTATHPFLLSFETSVAFCNPVNVVQQTHLNRVGRESSLSILSLLERYELGYRIDVSAFQGLTPVGCHQEVTPSFLPPALHWTSLTAALQVSTDSIDRNAHEPKARDALSLHASLKADELTEEELYLTLLALNACKVAATSHARAWLAELARFFIQQRTAIERDLSTLGKTASGYLSKNQSLETQLHAANQEVRRLYLETIEVRETAANDRERAQMLNDRERAQMLNKWAFRSLIGINSGIRLAKASLTIPALRSKCRFGISHASVSADRHLNIEGWICSKDSNRVPDIRAEVTRCNERRYIGAQLDDPPNITELGALNERETAGGFRFSIPLSKGLNIVLFQVQRKGKWRTFARRSVWNEHFSRTQGPRIITQERWPDGKPLVSVVLICRESSERHQEAIQSVFAQTWQDTELIIVDSGAALPDNIVADAQLKNPTIQLVVVRDSKLEDLRNAGVTRACGKYVCCIGGDERLMPTYLEKCLFRLETENLDLCDLSGMSRGHFSPADRSLAQQLSTAVVFKRALWKRTFASYAVSLHGSEPWRIWWAMGRAGAIGATLSEPALVGFNDACPTIPSPTTAPESPFAALKAMTRNAVLALTPGTLRFRGPKGSWAPSVVRNPMVNMLRNPKEGHDKTPHILVCLPFFTIGGAERLISQICKGLGAAHFRISVITTQHAPRAHGSAEGWFLEATQRIYVLPRFLGKHGWKQFILQLIHNSAIDILWLAGSEYVYELLPAIKTAFPMLKVIDLLFNEVGHTANNRKFDYCIDITVTESSSVHTWLRGHGEVDDRIRVIPNGIDLNLFTPRSKPVSDIQAGKFTVGYFGRLSHEKAPDIFVQIASHFKDQSGIQFLLAGDGPMMDEVSTLAVAHGLGSSLEIMGFTDSREHLRRCDVVIAPSRLDGRPNSVMEALASGIPVIASNVGGMAELISHGHTGFLCPAGSVPQFVEKVILLSQDRSLSGRMGENARRHAERHFDIRTTIASFGKIFSELKNGVPRCVSALEKPTA